MLFLCLKNAIFFKSKHFSNKIRLLCNENLKRGALKQRAEIIPNEPDAVNADEGNLRAK